MASFPRLMFQFAAPAIAALLWTAIPAVAADSAVPASETAVRPTPSRSASSHSHYDRRISAIRSNLGCSGVWCGRQFVLIVGVAY
jgi:hypothetical protein